MRDESTLDLGFDRSRSALACVACVALVATALGACSSSSSPGGNGDRLIVDSKTPPAPPAPPHDDAGPTEGGSPLYDASGVPDGYAPYAVCKQCACPAGEFCLGGIAGMTSLATCPSVPNATTLKVGCNAIPAACTAQPDCACLLQTLQSKFACYGVCSDLVGGLTVYCPVP